MARSYLAAAKLPKKFWYWAIREANIRSNFLPITQNANDINDVKYWSTPHQEFYGEKPDYRLLFPFGVVGAFRRFKDDNRNRTKFDSQCMLGIAIGRSEFTNGMIFYNPELDSFCVSADYLIDKQRLVGEAFPSIRYDGGLTTKVISNEKIGPSKYDIGDSVFIQCQTTYDILSGLVAMPPTSNTDTYTIKLDHLIR